MVMCVLSSGAVTMPLRKRDWRFAGVLDDIFRSAVGMLLEDSV